MIQTGVFINALGNKTFEIYVGKLGENQCRFENLRFRKVIDTKINFKVTAYNDKSNEVTRGEAQVWADTETVTKPCSYKTRNSLHIIHYNKHLRVCRAIALLTRCIRLRDNNFALRHIVATVTQQIHYQSKCTLLKGHHS